jgi:hypothetical protein
MTAGQVAAKAAITSPKRSTGAASSIPARLTIARELAEATDVVVDGAAERTFKDRFWRLRRALQAFDGGGERGTILCDEQRRQVRHLDRGRVAPDRGAVRPQNLQLVAHGVGVAHEVAGIGVLRDQAQRPALSPTADQDRDATSTAVCRIQVR